MRLVIVGASLGGLRTAQTVRASDPAASIVMIGAEPELPYDRPPLSKDVLVGRRSFEDVRLTSAPDLAALGVESILGMAATDLHLDASEVVLADSRRIGYDALVIATGSVARQLTVPSGMPDLVRPLRTLDDTRQLSLALRAARSVAIVGGGFIGAEVAATARDMGRHVTIVEPEQALMLRGLGLGLGQHLARLHQAQGVDVRLGTGVANVEPDNGRVRLALTDGSTLIADVAVAGIGASPSTGWLAGSGLVLDDGVICDSGLRALGAENVYAVGDVARWPHPRYEGLIRCEHWTTAGEHARVVAANLVGGSAVADQLPYVWSDQFRVRLQIAGRVQPGDELRYLLGDSESDRFVAATGTDAGINAVVARGAVRDFLSHRHLAAEHAAWPVTNDAWSLQLKGSR
jgi:NADPH-dependent 2,4-dienoyl-CoA reductase/sulfur reductase-like enzyme